MCVQQFDYITYKKKKFWKGVSKYDYKIQNQPYANALQMSFSLPLTHLYQLRFSVDRFYLFIYFYLSN